MATDPAMTRWRRLGYAVLSGLAGWFASQLVCLPVNLITAVRDSEGQAKLFVETLLYGLVVWGGWTALIAAVAWLAVVLPLVMTIRPCLLVRLRFVILSLAGVAALLLARTRPGMFRDPTAVSRLHEFAEFIPYAGFGFTFATVTAWMYILLSKRRLERADARQAVLEQTADPSLRSR